METSIFFRESHKQSAYRLLQNNRLRAGYNFRFKKQNGAVTISGCRMVAKFFKCVKNNELPFPESDTYRL